MNGQQGAQGSVMAILRNVWRSYGHGLNTFIIGALFLGALALFDQPPEAHYGIEDDVTQQEAADQETVRELIPLESGLPETAAPKEAPESPGATKSEAEPQPPEWKEYKIAKNDTMGRILENVVADGEAISFLLGKKLKTFRRLRPGRIIRYRLENDRLMELKYKTSSEYYLHFVRDGEEMKVSEDPPLLSATETRKSAVIKNSLYEAMDEINVGGNAIDGLITALETHIDFHRDLRKGDRFEMIYDEMRDEDQELVSTSRPKAFIAFNRNRKIVGVLSHDAQGYYTPKGESLQRAFLRSPVKFSRVSSKFSLRRYHPVLKKWRAHKGVDYAARRGTPVRASGDGTVTFAGKKGGYGNAIFIRHYKIYETVYGHLHRFAKGMRKGAKVVQGQVIGYVGSTGLATGPHLHYEFRVRGKHKDPLSTAVPVQLPPLEGAELEQYKVFAEPILARLELYNADEVAQQ